MLLTGFNCHLWRVGSEVALDFMASVTTINYHSVIVAWPPQLALERVMLPPKDQVCRLYMVSHVLLSTF